MKILHIETGMHLYGGAQQVVYLLKHLQEMQVDNVLVCSEGSEIEKAAGQYCEAVRTLSLPGKFGFGIIKSLKQIIHSVQPDLIHVHSRRLGMDLLGGIAAKLADVPAVISRRVDNPERPLVVKLKYKPYQQVITISEGIRQVLLAEGMPANKVVTVRSAVEANIYNKPCQRDEFLKTFNLPENSINIAVIAQLIHRKGHRHLLDVLPDIMQLFPNLNILFFGKGALHDELATSIQEKRLKTVHLAGFREDLSTWLGCLDIVVHPADMEGLGVSLLQASAAAVPVIATRAGGMPEIIRHGENGVLIRSGDTKALKAALIQLLENALLRQQMGKKGQEIIADEFSTRTMAQGNLSVYRRVLQ